MRSMRTAPASSRVVNSSSGSGAGWSAKRLAGRVMLFPFTGTVQRGFCLLRQPRLRSAGGQLAQQREGRWRGHLFQELHGAQLLQESRRQWGIAGLVQDERQTIADLARAGLLLAR